MPSPFPGMNPYLESPFLWGDFYQNLAVEIQGQLAPLLRPHYYAKLTPFLTFAKVPADYASSEVQTDLADYLDATSNSIIPPPPLVVAIDREIPFKLWTVEIRKAATDSLITAIEILSPVTKQPNHKDLIAYQQKRRKLMRTGINLLEIDLLRRGCRWTILNQKLPNASYFIFLWRVLKPQVLAIWPISIRTPIPLIPIPLRDPDPDVPLDLTMAIHNINERASYDMRIDYRKAPPKPNFSAEDRAWIKSLLATVA